MGATGTLQPQTMPTTSPGTGSGYGPNGFYAPSNPLYQYHDPSTSTQGVFQQGVNAAAPSQGISPQYQTILDSIQKQQDYANSVSAANASSLAAKRGLSGSSTEQFGVQQGLAQNSLVAQNAIQSTLGQNAQQQTQLQALQAQLYGNRANQLAGLNSDELTSLRNSDYSQQYLQLQQSLGQQGLNIQQQNIAANQKIAQQNAQNSLLQSGATLAAPYLFGGGGGSAGGAGFFSSLGGSLFGGSGAAGAGSLTGTAYTGAPGAASSLFPGGLGAVGTGTPALSAAGYTPGVGAVIGAGAGAMALANLGQKYGGTVGSFLANPIGAQLNLAKSALSSGGNAISNFGSDVSKAASSVFPF